MATVQIGDGDAQSGLFPGFAHRALEGRLAKGHFQLPPIGLQWPKLGAFFPKNEKMFAGLVLQEDKDADFVGEGGGHGDAGTHVRRRGLRRNQNRRGWSGEVSTGAIIALRVSPAREGDPAGR